MPFVDRIFFERASQLLNTCRIAVIISPVRNSLNRRALCRLRCGPGRSGRNKLALAARAGTVQTASEATAICIPRAPKRAVLFHRA